MRFLLFLLFPISLIAQETKTVVVAPSKDTTIVKFTATTTTSTNTVVTSQVTTKATGTVTPPVDPGPITPPPSTGVRKNIVVDHSYDGTNPFDAAKMYKQACCTYSVTQSKTVVRSGDGSFRAEVRGSDPQSSGGYRAEFIVTAQGQAITDGWYGQSIYFENWSACSSCGEHLPQWHPAEGSGSANLGIYTNKNTFNVQLNPEGDLSAVSLKDGKQIVSNKWYDIVWHVKWAASGGRIEMWIDGEKYVDYTGSTLTKGGIPYFKLGINRWNISGVNRVVYFDNVRNGNSMATYNDVAP